MNNILIVEPQPLAQAGLSGILDGVPDLTVAGQVDNEAAAVEFAETHEVDLLITEIRLASGDGISLVERVHRQLPHIRSVVLTSINEWLYCERALLGGARGFLTKCSGTDSIVQGIRQVLDGTIVVSEHVQQSFFSTLTPGRKKTATPGISQLSQRELQVFELIGAGMSTREIAEELDLSTKTIDTYRDKLKQKLHLDSSCRLNRMAVEWSLTMA